MSPASAPEPRSERRQVLHELRNAIHAIVTSNRCLAHCDSIPPEYKAFVVAIDKNGATARELLARLDQLIPLD